MASVSGTGDTFILILFHTSAICVSDYRHGYGIGHHPDHGHPTGVEHADLELPGRRHRPHHRPGARRPLPHTRSQETRLCQHLVLIRIRSLPPQQVGLSMFKDGWVGADNSPSVAVY